MSTANSIAAIYARYSTDQQREAKTKSECRERAKREGLDRCELLHRSRGLGRKPDAPRRPDASAGCAAGKFDIIIAEALDRISRDQEDIAGIYKRMASTAALSR